MAKSDELKKPVKEIVAKIVYKLAKASVKKAAAELRKKLKEEALHRAEEKLKEAAEQRLEKHLAESGQQLQKEILKDSPKGSDYSDYIGKIKQSLEKDFGKFLSSLKGMSPLAVTVISCVCAFVVGGIVVWFIKPTPPPPQPDLVITGITFQLEIVPAEEPPPETDSPLESPAATIWLWEDTLLYPVVIQYTIENQGNAAAGQSTSRLYFNGEAVAEDMVNPLVVGDPAEGAFYDHPFSADIFYSYFYSSSGYIDIEICADYGQSVEESNEENNCATIDFKKPY